MLKRVSIQNFKSLKDVTLDLQKVNLLIGPNNSGKTNFLKALEFFKDHYRKNNDYSIEDFDTYAFLKRAFQIDISIYNNRNDSAKLSVNKAYGIRKNFEENGVQKLTWGDYGDLDDEDIMSIAVRIYSYVENIKVYRIDPNRISKPAPIGEEIGFVSEEAANTVAFLDFILSEYRSIFYQIERDLCKCIPEFSEISLKIIKPTESLVSEFGNKTFKRLGLTDHNQNIRYWADELSEGTLYFIALLCIINQPNPPKLLLLEEPEKGIHPRRIREVMDFIFRLAEEKDVQIILTTHNENVLNEFTSIPEAVFVFEKDEEGATHVKNLLTDIIEPSHQRSQETGTKEIDFTSNLGENWMYGLLGGVPEEAL